MAPITTSPAAAALGVDPQKLRRWIREVRFDHIDGMSVQSRGFQSQREFTSEWIGAVAEELRGSRLETALEGVSDPDLRRGVVELLDHAASAVATGEVDQVIVTARRLGCLYQLLLGAGMEPLPHASIMLDRQLAMDPDRDWSGLRVLLLDDSVVVGTTIARLHERLTHSGAAVSARAVVADAEQLAWYLFEDVDFEAFHHRPSSGVERFATDVVTVLYQQQVPFFSDFPATIRIEVKDNQWSEFLRSPNWQVVDVTAPILDGNLVESISLIPTESALSDVLSRLPDEVGRLVSMIKLRTFSALEDGQRSVVAVPIALLSPCSPKELASALDVVSDHLGASPDQRFWRRATPEAQHRLLQIYVAACVLAETLPMLINGQLSLEYIDSTPTRLYFGDDGELVLAAFGQAVKRYYITETGTFSPGPATGLKAPQPSPLLSEPAVQDVLWEARELVVAAGYPESPETGFLTKVGLVFAHSIISVFGFLNRDYEMPEREQIRALRSKSAYDERFGNGRRFLDQCLTAQELADAIAPDHQGSVWGRALVSLGLDIGNDLGIIVPVTRYDSVRDVVYRAYRLGETAGLADTPLPQATRLDRRDEITKQVAHGYPMHNERRRVNEPYVPQGDVEGGLDDLLRLATLAAPGDLVSRYHGVVTAVSELTFDARLRSSDGDVRHGIMDTQSLSEDRAARLAPGLRFTWGVYRQSLPHADRSTSILTLRPDQPFDVHELEASAATAAALFDDLDSASGD